MSRAMKDVLAEKRQKWERLALRLEGLRPESVLKRGYAIVRREGRPLRSVSELRAGDPVEILLRDGRFGAEVKDVTS